MATIRPFRGVLYNQAKAGDMTKLISPPYDIITPGQQDTLYQSGPYNFVRIEYNRETPRDNSQGNRYTRAAAYIENWLEEGVLKQDEMAAFYLHAHSFVSRGRPLLRRDIMAAVRLEEWESRIIRPHENIIPRAKSDRMEMLKACQANTSQVLAMYADPQRAIAKVILEQEKGAPIMDFTDLWGDAHRVWAITQSEAVQTIQDEISQQPLYIADGHHRYDSALTVRREMAAHNKEHRGTEGYNFVLTSLIDFADPGLVILPTHRLIKGISKAALAGLKTGLARFFEILNIPLSSAGAWQKVDSFLIGLTPQMGRVNLAVYGLAGDAVTILTLKDAKTSGDLMPPGHGELYKKLDVSLVDHIILERLLGFDKDKEGMTLVFTHDRQEAIDRVKDLEYQLAFLLNPVGPEVIKEIADAGDRMPRKSTYFYPKAPAGLVFFKW